MFSKLIALNSVKHVYLLTLHALIVKYGTQFTYLPS